MSVLLMVNLQLLSSPPAIRGQGNNHCTFKAAAGSSVQNYNHLPSAVLGTSSFFEKTSTLWAYRKGKDFSERSLWINRANTNHLVTVSRKLVFTSHLPFCLHLPFATAKSVQTWEQGPVQRLSVCLNSCLAKPEEAAWKKRSAWVRQRTWCSKTRPSAWSCQSLESTAQLCCLLVGTEQDTTSLYFRSL